MSEPSIFCFEKQHVATCPEEETSELVIKPEELEKFKREYLDRGKHEFGYQIPHLLKLAEGYHQRYKDSHGDDRKWTDALRAHALYNSIKARDNDKAKWEEKAFEVQQTLWGKQVEIGLPYQQDLTERFAGKLEAIRSNARQKLLPLHSLLQSELTPENEIGFQKNALHISKECTDGLIELARDIFNESVKLLKENPPCPFSVVVFGSMAKGEATPYSDLEYLFLVEESSEANKRFFKLLAITSYFLIGNLAETKLSYMAVPELEGWFVDIQTNGFKIDGLGGGAGNIPTGNGLPDTENKFIVTPDDLAKKYIDVYDNPTEEALRGDLTAMLTYTKEVFSWKNEAKQLLSTFTAMKTPNEDNRARDGKNMEMLQNDVEKFKLKIGNYLLGAGYRMNVKKQFYRFPSIVLFDLIIFLSAKTEGKTSWETLEDLQSCGRISTDIANSLSFLLAAVCYIRLSTYLHHGSQCDWVSILECKQGDKEGEKDPWYVPQYLLKAQSAKYFPLQHVLSAVISQERSAALNKLTKQLRPSKLDSAWMLVTFGHYQDALELFKKADVDSDVEALDAEELTKLEWLAVVAFTYYECGEYSDSEKKFLKLLDRMETFLGFNLSEHIQTPQPNRENYDGRLHAVLLSGLAANQSFLKKHEDSLETQMQVVQICSIFPVDDADFRWHAMLGYGDKLIELKRLDEAEMKFLTVWAEHIEQSNEKLQDRFAEVGERTPLNFVETFKAWSPEERLKHVCGLSWMVAEAITSLGKVYYEREDYEHAKDYYLKAYELFQKKYGPSATNRDLINALYRLGHVHKRLQQNEKAKDYFQKGLEMHDSEGALQSKVTTLTEHGDKLRSVLGKSKEAQDYYDEAVNICKTPSFSAPESKMFHANKWKHLGNSYFHCKEYQKSCFCFEESLKLYEECYGDENNPDVFAMLQNLSSLYFGEAMSKPPERESFDRAAKYLKKVLHICESLQNKTAIRGIMVECLKHLAVTCKNLQEISDARMYAARAHDMYITLDDPSNQEYMNGLLQQLQLT